MTNSHVAQLVKMAHQIAQNLAAEGDAQTQMTATHINKFWTTAMKQRFLEYAQTHPKELPSALGPVVEVLRKNQ